MFTREGMRESVCRALLRDQNPGDRAITSVSKASNDVVDAIYNLAGENMFSPAIKDQAKAAVAVRDLGAALLAMADSFDAAIAAEVPAP